jgi:hypothetical protein
MQGNGLPGLTGRPHAHRAMSSSAAFSPYTSSIRRQNYENSAGIGGLLLSPAPDPEMSARIRRCVWIQSPEERPLVHRAWPSPLHCSHLPLRRRSHRFRLSSRSSGDEWTTCMARRQPKMTKWSLLRTLDPHAPTDSSTHLRIGRGR